MPKSKCFKYFHGKSSSHKIEFLGAYLEINRRLDAGRHRQSAITDRCFAAVHQCATKVERSY